MSILIKNMKMPEDCGACDLCTGDGECMALYGENLWNYIPDDAKYFPNDWKYEKCPLVEVPTPHGRLIDADDFGNRMYHEAFEKDSDLQKWDSGCWIRYKLFVNVLRGQPTVQPEIIHCGECIYYDPPHVENEDVRYEYSEMPKEAFDVLGTGLVSMEYGINIGGRCCVDYYCKNYSDDKRVYVPKDNYCGRAERRTDG